MFCLYLFKRSNLTKHWKSNKNICLQTKNACEYFTDVNKESCGCNYNKDIDKVRTLRGKHPN